MAGREAKTTVTQQAVSPPPQLKPLAEQVDLMRQKYAERIVVVLDRAVFHGKRHILAEIVKFSLDRTKLDFVSQLDRKMKLRRAMRQFKVNSDFCAKEQSLKKNTTFSDAFISGKQAQNLSDAFNQLKLFNDE